MYFLSELNCEITRWVESHQCELEVRFASWDITALKMKRQTISDEHSQAFAKKQRSLEQNEDESLEVKQLPQKEL